MSVLVSFEQFFAKISLKTPKNRNFLKFPLHRSAPLRSKFFRDNRSTAPLRSTDFYKYRSTAPLRSEKNLADFEPWPRPDV